MVVKGGLVYKKVVLSKEYCLCVWAISGHLPSGEFFCDSGKAPSGKAGEKKSLPVTKGFSN
jgi:hypothetical protein